MKDFFAKHRHLIVIALVFAVILAALTPSVIPLGLKLDEKIDLPDLDLNLPSPIVRFQELDAKNIQYYTVQCEEFLTNVENDALLKHVAWKDPEEIAALCAILNEAPLKRDRDTSDAERILYLSLYEAEDINGQKTSYGFSLLCADGQYTLTGTGPWGGRASWHISEESARALMAYCYCSKDSLHRNPRKDLCDAEQITSASLLTWKKQVKAEPTELTREQIEILCAFLEEELLPAQYSRDKYEELPHGSNGWQVTLSMQDGFSWQVQYNNWQKCLTLCRATSSSSHRSAALGYTYKDEAVLASLPELLN